MTKWRDEQYWRKTNSRDEAKVLKYIIDNCETDDFVGREYFINHSKDFEVQHPVFYDTDGIMKIKTTSSPYLVINKLVADGFLLPLRHEVIGSRERTTLELTDAGKYYFENRRKLRVNFILSSVIVPIVVTLLTLITVNLVKGALPAWLRHLLE